MIQYCIDSLNQQTKTELSNQMNLIVREIENKFSNITDYISEDFNGFRNTINPVLESLVNQGWGDIYWEQVVKFQDRVSVEIEKRITLILDDRVKLAIKAVAQAIAFYNDFLELQERYQQETPEQSEAEKAWINQQRRELEQVQQGIEAILY